MRAAYDGGSVLLRGNVAIPYIPVSCMTLCFQLFTQCSYGALRVLPRALTVEQK